MAGPLYPDVPKAQGVPPVRRDTSNAGAGSEAKLSRDSKASISTASHKWGVYTLGGSIAFDADSVAAVGYAAEYRIADFPIEEGKFESYDKVALPFGNRVLLTKGGKLSERQAFLKSIERAQGSTRLFNVVTPEATYLNVNIERVIVDRSAEQGAGLISAELMLREIRQSVTLAFAQTKEAASASPAHGGSVQASPAPAPAGVQ